MVAAGACIGKFTEVPSSPPLSLQPRIRLKTQTSKSHLTAVKQIKCCLQPGGKMWQHKWMHQLGKLLYIVERNRKISAAVASQPTPRPHNFQTDQNPLPPQRGEAQSVPRSTPSGSRDLSVDIVTQRPVLRASGQSVSRGFPPPYPSRYSPQGSRVGPQGGQKQAVSKGANALQRVSSCFFWCSRAISCFLVFGPFPPPPPHPTPTAPSCTLPAHISLTVDQGKAKLESVMPFLQVMLNTVRFLIL